MLDRSTRPQTASTTSTSPSAPAITIAPVPKKWRRELGRGVRRVSRCRLLSTPHSTFFYYYFFSFNWLYIIRLCVQMGPGDDHQQPPLPSATNTRTMNGGLETQTRLESQVLPTLGVTKDEWDLCLELSRYVF
jgi:hypothetical protein